MKKIPLSVRFALISLTILAALPAGAIVPKTSGPLDSRTVTAGPLHKYPAGVPLGEIADKFGNFASWSDYLAR